MGTKTIETPAVVEGSETTLGGTHGHRAVRVQCLEIGGYVFYRGVSSGALYEPCGRCDLSGHMRGFEHVAGGVCFSCGGAGFVGRKAGDTIATLQEVVRKRLVAKAAKARKAEREAEQARQAAAAWAAENAEVAEGLAAIRDRGQGNWVGYENVDTTLVEFAHKAARQALTEKQTAYAASLLAEQAEKDAAVAAEEARKAASQHLGTVNEKLTVTGTVKVATTVEVDSYSGYGTEHKRLVIVEVDGSEVKVFTQARWAWEIERGASVTLTGTVKKHGEYQGTAQTELGGRIKVG